MHLPCDVQHVVSWSSLLNGTQSSRQTHTDVLSWETYSGAENGLLALYNGNAMSVLRVQFHTVLLKKESFGLSSRHKLKHE